MKKLLLATALCAAFGVASAAEDVTADIVVIAPAVPAFPPPFRLTTSAPR